MSAVSEAFCWRRPRPAGLLYQVVAVVVAAAVACAFRTVAWQAVTAVGLAAAAVGAAGIDTGTAVAAWGRLGAIPRGSDDSAGDKGMLAAAAAAGGSCAADSVATEIVVAAAVAAKWGLSEAHCCA